MLISSKADGSSTSSSDPFGRYTQLTYDSSQRLASITDPIGITSTFSYSPTESTFVTSLTTPYGTSTFSDAAPTADPNEYSTTRALTMKDPLGYTEFLYYYQNDLGFYEGSDPAGAPARMGVLNEFLNYRNTYYYDKHAFNYPGAVTLNSNGSVNTENPYYSHVTHWIHDQYNFPNVTGRTPESIKPPLENRIWYNYPYQLAPQISGTIDSPSATGRLLDDGTTQLTQATYNGGDGDGHRGFGGRPTSITDALGRVTQFTYASNNIDLLTVQQNTSSGPTTIASFSNYVQHKAQTYTGVDGKSWQYVYNAAGQLHTITDPNTGVTTFNYDTTGRLSSVTNANQHTVLTLTYDSADRVHTRTDSEGYTLTYSYDNLDRVTQITYPDGTSDLYDWTFQSGPLQGTPSLELRKHTDRLGRVTTYSYDADRRLTSVTEPISNGVNRTTAYDYYENGVLKDITDANGNVTHWEIDLESRPVSKTYAYGTSLAETETLAYEQTTSRLKSITDALSQIKNYTYGLDDRLTGITYTNAANPTPNVTFGYDPYFPRLTSMTDGTGTTTYSYVPVGTNGALQLGSETGPFNNDSISYTYDALGRLSTRTIPGANEGFGYDAISRLTSHSTGLGTFNYGYLGQTSQTTSRSVTNGGTTVSTSWSYDTNTNDRRLIGISNSGITRSYTLGYLIPGGGGAKNPYDILSLTDSPKPGHPFGSASHVLGYDLSDRLLSESFPTPMDYHAYGYDLVDNPLTVTIGANQTHATYNQLNEISVWGGNNYFYDANGNTLSGDGTRSYKWDAEGRLVEIDYTGGNAKTQFSYDGLGRRTVAVETTAGGGTTTFHYLWCDGHLCQTRDSGDNVLRRDMAEGELNATTGQKLIYMPDQVGSVRDVLDGTTGTLLDAYDFAPYGSNERSYGSTPTDYRFAGLLLHAASGLNLGTYRAMDGVTGRFINRDPIGFSGGIDFYSYAGTQPITYTDLAGLQAGRGPTKPPMPVPGAPDSQWVFQPNPGSQGDRGGAYFPDPPVPSPDGSQPQVSWEHVGRDEPGYPGHWDVVDPNGDESGHYDRWGNKVPDKYKPYRKPQDMKCQSNKQDQPSPARRILDWAEDHPKEIGIGIGIGIGIACPECLGAAPLLWQMLSEQ